ncbi:4'-phosphopantetheinyl transferase superfamily protein [Sulfitobacter sp. HNIBRBA3233]|uniref:4'-phosphopantetheinyl transferase family protein n=1 Tax=Sulfitobacter marinivivus TaxID=3158558 RepID=UPI0032DF481E
MTPDRELIQALTQSVLPDGIAVAASDPTERPEAVHKDEAGAVAVAVPARQIEFLAGRAAAREAMIALGARPEPVPMGPDRAPIWPRGLTGSISHTADACVAAVGNSDDWAGIGVDLETAAPLERGLEHEICTTAERAWLDSEDPASRGLLARLIFSAKEAVFKAQYPLSRALFGFEVIELRIEREDSRFEATFQSAQGPFDAGRILTGSYCHAAGVLVTAVAIGQSDGTVYAASRR